MERRGFLTRLGLIGLGPLVLRPTPLLSAPTLPEGPFRLERALRRDLFDGNAITVRRSWRIRFGASGGGGLAVEGEQIDCTVDAPPALAALARLEEQREAVGLLPAKLTRTGRIVDQAGDAALGPLPGMVIEAAADFIATRAAPAPGDLELREFLPMLSQRQMAWLSHVPRDLFFPVPRSKTATREIALPDGTQGRVNLREVAAANARSGLLESFVREAITSIGSDTRSATETWQLSSAV